MLLSLPLLVLFPALDPPLPSPIDLDVEPESIWERLSFFANGRIRWESTFDQLNGEDRHRGRMRLRLGGRADVTETVRAEARLSTASDGGDANNPHWDFGDGNEGFNGGDVVLDRLFLAWNAMDDLDVRAGKLPHVFAQPPVLGELMWDNDVHPSGLAVLWAPECDSELRFDLRLAEYVAVENSGDADPAMFGVQGNAWFRPAEGSTVQASCSYSDWYDLDAGAGVLANQGNTDVAGPFGVVDGFLAWTWDEAPTGRAQTFVEVMHNVEDDAGEDMGYALGAKLGPSGQEGDFNVFGSWYDLEANALFSPVAQDDTPIGGTGIGNGMQGVIAGMQYFVAENLSLKLWVLTSDADAAEDPFRVRFDVDFSVK